MKLATTTCDFAGYTNKQEEAMEYISKAGFKYVDYAFGLDYRNNNGIFSNDPKSHIENVKRKADALGLKFVQAHSPMGSPITKDVNYQKFIDDTNRSIEACAELGIKNIVVHAGYERGITKEECFSRNKEFYMELLKVAEKYDVNILTENFNKMFDPEIYWIDSAPDMLELIEYIDHPLFHGCWDTGHGNLQKMPPDEALRILGKHVYALHVQDNRGDDDHHVAPYFGTMNLDSVINGLFDIGYKGYFTFESDCMLLPAYKRRRFEKDDRLFKAPIEVALKAEELLYQIGKSALSAYDCFEE